MVIQSFSQLVTDRVAGSAVRLEELTKTYGGPGRAVTVDWEVAADGRGQASGAGAGSRVGPTAAVASSERMARASTGASSTPMTDEAITT